MGHIKKSVPFLRPNILSNHAGDAGRKPEAGMEISG
jgi:hypothetical protein